MNAEQLPAWGIEHGHGSVMANIGTGNPGEVLLAMGKLGQEPGIQQVTISPAAARHLADVLNRAADEAERAKWEKEATA